MSKALENLTLLRTIDEAATADDVLTKDANGTDIVWEPIPAPPAPPDPTTLDPTATISSFLVGFRDIPVSSTWERGKCNVVTANATLNTSDMGAGYCFSVYNNSASAVTIVQGSGVTLRLGGTTTTGNRSLAARGMATIWCRTGTEAIIIGVGLS